MNHEIRDKLNRIDDLLKESFWILDNFIEKTSEEADAAVCAGVADLLESARNILAEVNNEDEEHNEE